MFEDPLFVFDHAHLRDNGTGAAAAMAQSSADVGSNDGYST